MGLSLRCNAQIGVTLAFRVKDLSGNFLSRPPTHPPGAEVCICRTTIRDVSAIPCRGTRGVRAERGVGTLRRYHPGGYLVGTKAWSQVLVGC